MAEWGRWFRRVCSSAIEMFTDSVEETGIQSRYARSFNQIMAVNSVAPVWRLTHQRMGNSRISM